MRISDWSSDVCSSDLLPMKIREGSNIPSWPGLGVRVVAPIANSDSTVIPKKGTKPRAITRGADRITVLERGCDREIIHCIGSFCSLRKRVLARTDKTIITSAKTMADRKSVVSGKSVSVRVNLGGRRSIKKKKTQSYKTDNIPKK